MISNLKDTIRLLFVTEKKPFLELKSILGFYPHDLKLYQLALRHKSVAYYERERLKEEAAKKGVKRREIQKVRNINNERLEFLGDAMLGAIVASVLYKHYGNKQEGFLTSLRSKIVCRRSLNNLAVDLGLDKLILHTGAVTTGHNSYMNGNAFEAFIGAIYLDRGYEYCYQFIEDVVFKKYIDIDQVAHQEENFKSALIEWCQKYQYVFMFSQKETRESAERGTPIFHSAVCIEGVVCGLGKGYSKKEADQRAAEEAVKRVKQDKKFVEEIKNAFTQRRKPQTAQQTDE